MQNIIYEYEEIKDKDLENHIIESKELHNYFTLDWKSLKASKYCGILNFKSQDFYILPKIANSNDEQKNLNIFIYMLIYAYDIKLSNEQIATCANQTHTILEVFVQMFAKNLLDELKCGIFKEYISKEENLKVLKGKYLINENLKYNFTKDKIYCQYDEFCENNTLNEFFLYAVKTLQKYIIDKKLLKQCELIFDEVEYKHFDINRSDIHFNRLNLRFKESYEIALLLLKQLIPLFQKDKKSFAFLFDMNVLFEKFIARIVKEIYDNVEIPTYDKDFGELSLRPDIILKSKNLIIDCKYKKIKENKKANRNDRYQMYVYANNFENKNSTMLLYPKHLDDIDEDMTLGKNDKQVELKIKTIDLDSVGNDFRKYIEEIKKRVEEIL